MSKQVVDCSFEDGSNAMFIVEANDDTTAEYKAIEDAEANGYGTPTEVIVVGLADEDDD